MVVLDAIVLPRPLVKPWWGGGAAAAARQYYFFFLLMGIWKNPPPSIYIYIYIYIYLFFFNICIDGIHCERSEALRTTLKQLKTTWSFSRLKHFFFVAYIQWGSSRFVTAIENFTKTWQNISSSLYWDWSIRYRSKTP